MNKKQIANLLGAGTLTGLIIAASLLFSTGNTDAAAADTPEVAPQIVQQEVPAEIVISAPVAEPQAALEMVTVEDYSKLQAQNAQLEQAMTTLQDREIQYKSTIEQANTLLEQQQETVYVTEVIEVAQPAAQVAAPAYSEHEGEDEADDYEDGDEDEDDDYEDGDEVADYEDEDEDEVDEDDDDDDDEVDDYEDGDEDEEEEDDEDDDDDDEDEG